MLANEQVTSLEDSRKTRSSTRPMYISQFFFFFLIAFIKIAIRVIKACLGLSCIQKILGYKSASDHPHLRKCFTIFVVFFFRLFGFFPSFLVSILNWKKYWKDCASWKFSTVFEISCANLICLKAGILWKSELILTWVGYFSLYISFLSHYFLSIPAQI